MLFQVQYKRDSKTFHDDFEATTYNDILSLFDDLSACEVTEIREYKISNQNYKIDDGNYIKSCSVFVSNEKGSYSFKIPKLKKTISDDELKTYILQYIKIGGLPPNTIKTKKQF